MMNTASVGLELQKRGHRFTLFATPDLASVAETHRISFQPLDNSKQYVPGVKVFRATMEAANGLSYRKTLEFGLGEIALYCEQAPKAMRDAGVQCLIADQVVLAARTIAECLTIPFITMCNTIPLNTDLDVPPSGMLWRPQPARWNRYRNRLFYQMFSLFTAPFLRKLNKYRRALSLPPHRAINDTFSTQAQITQLVPEFDFPFHKQPTNFHYVGPYRRDEAQAVEFSYDQLDGRPLIFASLGTLLKANPNIWRIISESCLNLDAQLVISLGAVGRLEDYRDWPGRPLVVSYAPQRELLKRAALMISHGGLNSVMETLAEGVPLIVLPAFGDQPGVAMRVAASGAGEVIPFAQCTTDRLKPLIRRVFTETKYKLRALSLKESIQNTRGIQEAADIIEFVSQHSRA
jgi:zeaxanthin glucosyltransferase